MDINVKKFSLEKMSEKLGDILSKYVKDAPQPVSLKLPKLKRVENSKPKLTKLKKV